VAETGVPKFVSGKTISYVIGGIVIVVALVVAFNYISAVFGEYIEIPKGGEKTRFMRYMSCAIAMCTARNRKNDNDGCTSDRVMELVVEYDEGGNPVKGCQEVCWEVKARPSVGTREHYCDQESAISFTFKDSVRYVGNRSGCSELDIKKDLQTDISCVHGFESFMSCEMGCGRTNPYGMLIEQVSGCGTETPGIAGAPSCGTICISDVLASNCEPGEGLLNNGLAWCDFNTDDTIYIWVKNLHAYTIPSCDPWLRWCIVPIYSGPHDCPRVAICEHN